MIKTEVTRDNVIQSLEEAGTLYHRLVLLVGEAGSGKTGILRDVAKAQNVSVININLVLSDRLLELTTKQRVLRVSSELMEIAEGTQSPLILDNIEILFETHLKQDPLRLLQAISRNRVVLASWNGVTERGDLLYAEPDHSEYRRYIGVDALLVGMDGSTTINSSSLDGEAKKL